MADHDHCRGGIAFLWPPLPDCDRAQRLWWDLRPLRWGALHNESSSVPQISCVVAGGCSQTHVLCQALASVQKLPLFHVALAAATASAAWRAKQSMAPNRLHI